MSFEEILAGKTAHCEKVLCEMLPDADKLQGSDRFAEVVVRAMQYSVMAGGKRLRPLFLYETCRMYGGREELAAPFMAALEMIHNYSLVHDDMPAMDNDEYRRGRKTTWLVYGEGMAILTGDALLNYAYETAVKAFDLCVNAAETANCVNAMKLLARNAGIYGMVGGQIGAILAGAPRSDVEKLGKIAENIGIAFQIQDDILDVIGDSEELGKLTGSDEKDGKVTYVTMHGLEKSAEDVRRMSEEALELYDSLTVSNDFLRELIVGLITRTK